MFAEVIQASTSPPGGGVTLGIAEMGHSRVQRQTTGEINVC